MNVFSLFHTFVIIEKELHFQGQRKGLLWECLSTQKEKKNYWEIARKNYTCKKKLWECLFTQRRKNSLDKTTKLTLG